METNTSCTNCSKPLYRKPSYLKRYNKVFCDRKCHHEHLRSHQEEVKCEACKKVIKLNGSRKRNSKTGLYFCSNECKNPYIAKHKRWGNKNPDTHRSRRPIVIEAAKGKCQSCGYNDDERMFDLHHHDEDHSNNDWSNLRCVCAWCHIMHHRKVKILDLPELDYNKTGYSTAW